MTLTKEDAAKLVKRTVTVPKIGKDKKPVLDDSNVPVLVESEVDVTADEVLDFVVRNDNELTVITTDGKKLYAYLPAAK